MIFKYYGFLILILIILILLLYFSTYEYFENETTPPITDNPELEETPTPINTSNPLQDVAIFSNAESNQDTQQNSASFDLVVPGDVVTPAPIDCSYGWTNWGYCDISSGYITRNIITVPPKYNGKECTEPPIKDTQISCLDDIQFKNNLTPWKIEYTPKSVQNIGTTSVVMTDPSSNANSKFAAPTMFTTPYVYVGFNNRGGEFTKITSPTITLSTTILLGPGYYDMEYYIQDYSNDNGNQGITVGSSVNSFQNVSYIFEKSKKWVHQVISFNITEDDATQPAVINFIFTLEKNKMGYENAVALGGIKFKFCGNSPCVVDCDFEWKDWGSCNQLTGIQTRNPIVMVKSANNGKECPNTELKDCAVDCSYSIPAWSACEQETGIKTRNPIINIKPLKGGKACPTNEKANCPVDCSYTWTNWSVCDTNGIQTRKPVVKIETKNGGLTCPPTQQQSCNFDCSYVWSDWSKCDKGLGTQTRKPNIFFPQKNNGKVCPSTDVRKCTVNCEYTWGNWSACDNNNTSMKYRDPIISINPLNNGDKCPQREIGSCPIDCKYSWSDWGTCNVNSRTQTRKLITVPPVNPNLGAKGCTPAPETNTTKSCLDNLDFSKGLGSWDILYNPANIIGPSGSGPKPNINVKGSRDVFGFNFSRNYLQLQCGFSGYRDWGNTKPTITFQTVSRLPAGHYSINYNIQTRPNYPWQYDQRTISIQSIVMTSSRTYVNSAFMFSKFAKSKIKNGNNGTVSCDTFCAGDWDGGRMGRCLNTINNDGGNGRLYRCDTVASSIVGPTNISCNCEYPSNVTGHRISTVDDENKLVPQNNLFYISEEESNNDTTIGFIFTVTDPLNTGDCTVALGDIDLKYCGYTTPCDVNCQYTWGGWSECDIYSGTKYREPNIYITGKNGGSKCPNTETVNCDINCQTVWSGWSGCDEQTGYKYNKANNYIQNKNNGNKCPDNQSQKCDVDCKYTVDNWSDCKPNGTQTRNITKIDVYAKNNGKPCPSSNTETRNCSVNCDYRLDYYDCDFNAQRKRYKVMYTNNGALNGGSCPYSNGQIITSNEFCPRPQPVNCSFDIVYHDCDLDAQRKRYRVNYTRDPQNGGSCQYGRNQILGSNDYCPNPNLKATFYKHANYNGDANENNRNGSWEKSFSPGRYKEAHEFGMPHDDLTSMRIPRGLKVTLFEHGNYNGRSKSFTSDVANLKDHGFNDMASSFIIENIQV